MDCPVNPAVGSVIDLDLTTNLPATATNVTYTKITGTGTITGSTYTETVSTGDTVIQVERCYDSAVGDCTPMYTRQFVSGDGTVATITYTNTGSQTLVFSAGGASVTVAPGASGTLTQVPISGTQACAGIDCVDVGAGGQVCDIYSCSFTAQGNAIHALSETITAPDGLYPVGDTPPITAVFTNTGNQTIDSLTIELIHPDPPCEITGVGITPSTTSAQFTWTIINTETGAPKVATGRICYGTDPNNLNLETAGEDTLNFSTHIQTVNPLQPNTTYYYEIKSTEGNGFLVTSTGSFTTL